MDKFWKIAFLVLGICLLFLAAIFATRLLKPKDAGIEIETNPLAIVFINGVQVGQTPYEAILKPGEISLKLVPAAGEGSQLSFETRVLLSPGVKTTVRRNFAETESASSGEIVSSEKTGEGSASLAIVSDPDSAQFSIDGTPRGFTPHKMSSIAKGTHQIVVSAPGYIERNLTVNAITGYKLTIVIKLSLAAPAPVPSPTPSPIEKVKILQTPSGFLRVRAEPNTSSEEVARVKPGETYLLLGKDTETGWLKIEYLTGQTGWISDQFAQIETPP